MKCTKCGHLNLEDAHFCSSCGAETRLVAGAVRDANQRDSGSDSGSDSGEATLSIAVVDSAEPNSSISATPAAFIHVVRGPNAGSKFALNVGSLEVGRHPASGIFLDDITVSRRHCVFNCIPTGPSVEVTGGTDFSISVSDVGSLNGTYVNRKLITRSDLSVGDEVQIGRYVVTIESAR